MRARPRPQESTDAGDGRDGDVAPVADAEWRDGADEQVACDAARIRGGEGEDENPEKVEAVADPGRRAAQGEDEGAEEIEDDKGGADEYLLISCHG